MNEATKAARAMKQAKTHEEFHRASLQYVQALKNKPTPPNPDAPKAKTMTDINQLIDQAKAQGLTVYAPETLTSYFYFTDGQRIGYAQSNRSGPSFSTVHKPNRTTGTGFAAKDFAEALSFAPPWATGRDCDTVNKYSSWQDFARNHWQPLTQQ